MLTDTIYGIDAIAPVDHNKAIGFTVLLRSNATLIVATYSIGINWPNYNQNAELVDYLGMPSGAILKDQVLAAIQAATGRSASWVNRTDWHAMISAGP